MCTVGDIVNYMIGILNDDEAMNEHVRWPQPLMINALANAIAKVSSSRMELFSHPVDIVLEPGCVHDVCDVCTNFGGVIAISDPERGGDNCDPVNSRISDADLTLRKKFGAVYTCDDPDADEKPYDPGGIAFDPMHPCVFKTMNPVPDDREIIATINCATLPNADDIISGGMDYVLPEKICIQLRYETVELTLSQLWEIDTESNIAVERAKMHFQNFQAATKINLSTSRDRIDRSPTIVAQMENIK